MSKRFKGKTCVYCGAEGASSTGDHVFAREFFPLSKRHNLPQVPACERCNRAKADLEHYLTALLPFGGKHDDALPMLQKMVPPRLAKNAKLHRALARGQSHVWEAQNGVYKPTMTLPFDGEKLAALFRYIVKGLVAHHWGVQVPADYYVQAGMLTAEGERLFEKTLALNAVARVKASLGDGAFEYEGAQSESDPRLSIWKFKIYGGLKLTDHGVPGESPSHVWASTSRVGVRGLQLASESEPQVVVR